MRNIAILISGMNLSQLMYVNPTGCNPSGATIPLGRKKEFYSLACEYNFLILEDDPYYALHFMEVRGFI